MQAADGGGKPRRFEVRLSLAAQLSMRPLIDFLQGRGRARATPQKELQALDVVVKHDALMNKPGWFVLGRSNNLIFPPPVRPQPPPPSERASDAARRDRAMDADLEPVQGLGFRIF